MNKFGIIISATVFNFNTIKTSQQIFDDISKNYLILNNVFLLLFDSILRAQVPIMLNILNNAILDGI